MDAGAESYRRFLEGEEDAMLEIVREYNDGLVLYLNSFVNNISVADELAEDTFVRLGLKKPNHKLSLIHIFSIPAKRRSRTRSFSSS